MSDIKSIRIPLSQIVELSRRQGNAFVNPVQDVVLTVIGGDLCILSGGDVDKIETAEQLSAYIARALPQQ